MRTLRLLKVLLILPALTVLPTAGQEAQNERHLDPSLFKVPPPSSRLQPAGTFRYTSPLGGGTQVIEIVEHPEGFWRYEGTPAEGPARVLLELDPVPGLAGYQGQAGEGFDPCLPEGGRVYSVLVYPGYLSVEVVSGYHSLPERLKRDGCREVGLYRVVARGGSERVRLIPYGEIMPHIWDLPPQAPTSRDPRDTATDDPVLRKDPEPVATYTTGAPRVAAGTPVRVTKVLVDRTGNTWHRVEVIVSGGSSEEPGEEPYGETLEEKEEGAMEDQEGDRREEGPPAGWVRAEQVVGRVTYTFERLE